MARDLFSATFCGSVDSNMLLAGACRASIGGSLPTLDSSVKIGKVRVRSNFTVLLRKENSYNK